MDAWPRCLERLEAELPAEDIHTWLKPLQATRRDDTTVLYAYASVTENGRVTEWDYAPDDTWLEIPH